MSTAAPTTEPAETAREKKIPGEAGLWIFIFGDMTLFAAILTAYLLARADDPAVFAASQESLSQDLGALNTLFLLFSSLCVVLAFRALRSGRRAVAPRLLVTAWGFGACFVVVKAIEYRDRIAADDLPGTNDFFLYYFVSTGLHLVHLLVGMALLVALWRLSKRPSLTRGHWMFMEGAACFWHMVDLLWIAIFPLVFLVR